MTKQIAEQIAELLNTRNQLVITYTGESILKSSANYVYLEDSGKIIALAESKKVQWYQWEISHVVVAEEYEGKGYGNEILALAEAKAQDGGAKVLQCTIRTSNDNSIRLFSRKGYSQVSRFFYPKSGNWVYVYQKVISVK
jgi:ribosomal protein S18 acetylase RimI-like enzyme